MKICFATCDTLNSVWQEKLWKVGRHDVLVFGFNGLGLVSYKKELGGETEYFQDLARFSKQLSSVVISGCDTDSYGVFHHSAVVADCGKILGVSDMVHVIDDSEYSPSGNFRVYDTSAGKIGLIIAEDLFFPESARVLTLCDADIIICLFKKVYESIPQVMIRAGAFSNGIPMALCAENYTAISDIHGNIVLSGCQDILNAKINIEKDYHLVSSRRRGMYRDFDGGY